MNSQENRDARLESSREDIWRRYLIVTHLGTYGKPDGTRGFSELWHKDLVEHARYTHRLVLAAPFRPEAWRSDIVAVRPEDFPGCDLQFLDLPYAETKKAMLRSLPAIAARLWKGIGQVELVHIGVTGGFIPLGWIAGPIAKLRKKRLIVLIESAPWLPVPGSAPSLRARLRCAVFEFFARSLCSAADVSFYTHRDYLDRYLRKDKGRGHVICASWIDEDKVMDPEPAGRAWERKLQRPVPLRLGLFSRLVPSKGILVALEAMALLSERGIKVSLDIFGAGELLEACQESSRRLGGSAEVRVRGTLPYDDSFFAEFRELHAVLIPNLSDEQPRIAYDAFSQSVPVIASDTTGLRECVAPGVNGVLLPPGDARSLAEAIALFAESPERLRSLGLAGLETARRLTHRQMHLERRDIIVRALGN